VFFGWHSSSAGYSSSVGPLTRPCVRPTTSTQRRDFFGSPSGSPAMRPSIRCDLRVAKRLIHTRFRIPSLDATLSWRRSAEAARGRPSFGSAHGACFYSLYRVFVLFLFSVYLSFRFGYFRSRAPHGYFLRNELSRHKASVIDSIRCGSVGYLFLAASEVPYVNVVFCTSSDQI